VHRWVVGGERRPERSAGDCDDRGGIRGAGGRLPHSWRGLVGLAQALGGGGGGAVVHGGVAGELVGVDQPPPSSLVANADPARR
jgi:hypothetical protein